MSVRRTKIFFGGPRTGIAQQRDDALQLLKAINTDGSVEVISFDWSDVAAASVDASVFLQRVSRCDAAIFAIGDNPGLVFENDKGPTTWTLQEWELAVKVRIPIYLLLSRRLDEAIGDPKNDTNQKAVWKFLRDSLPTKHVSTFDLRWQGSLRDLVIRAILKFQADRNSLEAEAGRWVERASEKIFSLLTTPGLAAEIEKAMFEVSADLSDKGDRNVVQLWARAYTLRRYSKNPEQVSGVANAWLYQAWLLLTHTHLDGYDIKICEELGDKPEKWLDEPQRFLLLSFSLLPPCKQKLILYCLREKGLIYRYLWDFDAEVRIEEFVKELASLVNWKELEAQRDRFYEVYLGALAYAGRVNALRVHMHEIDRLQLAGSEGNGRKLQLRGLCAYVTGDQEKGIRLYQKAIVQFKIDGEKWLKNVAHSYVMIAAMEADGKSVSKVVKIKRKYEEKILKDTAESVSKIANAFYWRAWQGIDKGSFEAIWTKG